MSIGAVRIVNGRLLEHEVFEQLVDPAPSDVAGGDQDHRHRHAMLANQPTIDKVLPAFRAFCEDTVLVAHNAAFDMRFLHLKEEATGVRFTQPVLDTLLLSAVHPSGPRRRTASRRSPSGWASTRSGGTRRWATRS